MEPWYDISYSFFRRSSFATTNGMLACGYYNGSLFFIQYSFLKFSSCTFIKPNVSCDIA